MDAKTLKALKGSIKKWEKIVEGEGIDDGGKNCPLCKLYSDKDCRSCPVCAEVDNYGCHDTPYDEWESHHENKHEENELYRKVYCPTCKELAQKELDFLKSLLLKEEK